MTDRQEPLTPRGRSLVCSIARHFECDGNAPNGPAGVGNPCGCACHAEVPQPTPQEERDAVLAERIDWEAQRAARQEAADTSELRAAAQYMLDLVDAVYGTDHEPDPDNLNDAGARAAEAEFRRHRAVIERYAAFHADNFSDPIEHAPHRGNHEGYACGFSGPHCWACNEPWPCRAERGRAPTPEAARQEAADTSGLTVDRLAAALNGEELVPLGHDLRPLAARVLARLSQEPDR